MCLLASEIGKYFQVTHKPLRHIENIAQCADLVCLGLICLHPLTLIVLVDLVHHQLPECLLGVLPLLDINGNTSVGMCIVGCGRWPAEIFPLFDLKPASLMFFVSQVCAWPMVPI